MSIGVTTITARPFITLRKPCGRSYYQMRLFIATLLSPSALTLGMFYEYAIRIYKITSRSAHAGS